VHVNSLCVSGVRSSAAPLVAVADLSPLPIWLVVTSNYYASVRLGTAKR